MPLEPLPIAGSWVFTPDQHPDQRGLFLEWFRGPELAVAVGTPLDVAQANCSVSGQGVLRGIHYTDVPPGQAKYVTCVSGAVFDVVVDLRVGSATFGQWTGVQLDTTTRRCVYLSEGLGHGFVSLAPDSAVVYLCSSTYSPTHDRGVNPLDAELGIEWPTRGLDGSALSYQLSAKDEEAPTLQEAGDLGLLPRMDVLGELRAAPAP